MKKVVLVFGALLACSLANATIIYDNMNNLCGNPGDPCPNYFGQTQYGVPPSSPSSNISQIGDNIFSSSALGAVTGTVEFGNLDATDATFSATMRFWNVGSPVGTQIGGNFTVNNITVLGTTNNGGFAGYLRQGFSLLAGGNALQLPSNVVFTVEVTNFTGGLLNNLGLTLYGSSGLPPDYGSSSLNFAIAKDNGVFSTLVISGCPLSSPQCSNVGFTLDAVPEPATYAMMGAGLAVIGLLRRRK